MKLKKWYYLQFSVWFICYSLQVFYSSVSLSTHSKVNETITNDQLYLVFGAFTIVYLMVYTGMSILLIFKFSSYTRGMIDFHKFINSYR